MNTKLKKSLYLGGTTLAIGGISAGIIVPIVLATKPSHTPWDGDDATVGGGMGSMGQNDLDDEIKDSDYNQATVLNNISHNAAFFSYEKEQAASLEYQMRIFKKEITDKVKDIHETYEDTSDPKTKEEKINELVKDISKIVDKTNVLADVIKNTEDGNSVGDFYTRSKFSSEYPEVLQIESEVRKRQEKVLKDAKEAFIKKYPTHKEGLDAWYEERKTSYGDARSDKEAVDHLVFRQISNDANAQFRFRIVDSFTVEDFVLKDLDLENFDVDNYKWNKDTTNAANAKDFVDNQYDYSIEERDGTNTEDFLFPYLDHATIKDYATEEIRKNSSQEGVYFLGTSSKQEDKINVVNDIANNPLTEKLLSNSNLLKTSHALINVKPNENGAHLAWTVDNKDVLKKLYKKTDQNVQFVPAENMTKLFGDSEADQKATDRFIKLGSGNSEGTINKKGVLGLKRADEFVTSMVGGFGSGLALAYHGLKGKTINTNNQSTNVLLELQTKLLAEVGTNGFFGDLSTNLIERNKQIDQVLENKTDEDINKVFGQIFKDVFDSAGKGLQLVYVANDNFNTPSATDWKTTITISEEHGVHITHLELIDNTTSLQTMLEEDLKEIAQKQNVGAASVEFNTLFSNFYDELNQLDFLIEDIDATDKSDFYKYYLENAYEEKDETQAAKDIKNIVGDIKARDLRLTRNRALEAFNSKSDWYKDSLYSRTRTTNQMLPKDMYDIYYKMSKKGGL